MGSIDPLEPGLRRTGIVLLALACLGLTGGAAEAVAQVPANGRAWELVTPGEPFGAVVDRAVGVSADGDRVAYQTWGSIPGASAGELVATSLAVRTPSGWDSRPESLPIEVPVAAFEYLLSPLVTAFDAGLTGTVRTSNLPLVPGGPEAPRTGIYRVDGDGATLLASVEGGVDSTFLGASTDLSHVVFQSAGHLLPSDAGRTSGKSIYESTAGGLRQVDVAAGGSLLSACGSAVAALSGVSESGERVFFTNPASGCGIPKRLYLREGDSTTVEVSASHCARADCNAPRDAEFLSATPDGSVVFFATTQQLVDEDENALRDLYRYDVESGSLELVSARSPGQTGVVQGEVQTAADGSRVYFFAEGRLLAGLGSESGRNLYMADATGLHFVAATGKAEPLAVSRDGGVALFETSAALESADTDGKGDAYLYDAGADKLTRVSAGTDGNGPFDVELKTAVPRGGGLFNLGIDAPFGGSLSEDGSRVFFTTAESLLPEDRNEVADVYEWTGGRLGLISSGEGDDAAEFAGADADGTTALFRTSASLVAEDRDGGDHDLYAARIAGGFPPEAAEGTGCGACSSSGAAASRPTVASSAPPAPNQGRLRVGRLGRRAGARALASGSLRLRVYVPGPGKIVANAGARLGRRFRSVARGVAGAVRPGRVRLRLVLSTGARTMLRRRKAIRLRLAVRQGDLRLARPLVLRAGRRRR